MARKVSNTYLPPSLLWTLQTGNGNQWQAEIEKFQFPPFPYTHTITKITCDRLRRDFLNFWGVGWIWGRILCARRTEVSPTVTVFFLLIITFLLQVNVATALGLKTDI